MLFLDYTVHFIGFWWVHEFGFGWCWRSQCEEKDQKVIRWVPFSAFLFSLSRCLISNNKIYFLLFFLFRKDTSERRQHNSDDEHVSRHLKHPPSLSLSPSFSRSIHSFFNFLYIYFLCYARGKWWFFLQWVYRSPIAVSITWSSSCWFTAYCLSLK